MSKFQLEQEDFYAIEIAKNLARRLLKHPQIKPLEIIGLGNALYALERLPLVTLGSSTEFGISYQAGTEDFHEKRYVEILISNSEFEISVGGSVYDKAVGGDTISETKWLVEVGGYRNVECELHKIDSTISEYLQLDFKINVHDGSDIEYEIESE